MLLFNLFDRAVRVSVVTGTPTFKEMYLWDSPSVHSAIDQFIASSKGTGRLIVGGAQVEFLGGEGYLQNINMAYQVAVGTYAMPKWVLLLDAVYKERLGIYLSRQKRTQEVLAQLARIRSRIDQLKALNPVLRWHCDQGMLVNDATISVLVPVGRERASSLLGSLSPAPGGLVALRNDMLTRLAADYLDIKGIQYSAQKLASDLAADKALDWTGELSVLTIPRQKTLLLSKTSFLPEGATLARDVFIAGDEEEVSSTWSLAKEKLTLHGLVFSPDVVTSDLLVFYLVNSILGVTTSEGVEQLLPWPTTITGSWDGWSITESFGEVEITGHGHSLILRKGLTRQSTWTALKLFMLTKPVLEYDETTMAKTDAIIKSALLIMELTWRDTAVLADSVATGRLGLLLDMLIPEFVTRRGYVQVN